MAGERVEGRRGQGLVFGVRCSVFGFQFSVFSFQFSVCGVRCSVFGFRCSVFGVARVAERRHDEAPDFSLGNTAPNHHQSRSDDRRLSVLLFICHWSLVIGRSCKLARLVFLSLGLQPTLELILLKDSHSRSHPIMSFAA